MMNRDDQNRDECSTIAIGTGLMFGIPITLLSGLMRVMASSDGNTGVAFGEGVAIGAGFCLGFASLLFVGAKCYIANTSYEAHRERAIREALEAQELSRCEKLGNCFARLFNYQAPKPINDEIETLLVLDGNHGL